MRALVCITHTDCENKYRSLEACGYEVHLVQYDDRPHHRHTELVERAEQLSPDFIVHIGAVEEFHGRPVPQPETFRALRGVAPLIHMCNDAADPPWWPTLELYDREDCFDVQVAIDGNPDCPIAAFKNGLVALTPIDPRPFEQHMRPWTDRPIKLGMIGGIGHTGRRQIVLDLQASGDLTFQEGPVGRTYDEMAAALCDCRAIFNYGVTGSGRALHVKGRVVEAGFAGAALFELKGSPAQHWLMPGADYFEYENADHLRRLAIELDELTLKESAANLYARMTTQYHPKEFWRKVLVMAFKNHLDRGRGRA